MKKMDFLLIYSSYSKTVLMKGADLLLVDASSLLSFLHNFCIRRGLLVSSFLL